MTYDHTPRTPEEIEADIERERSALHRTIDSIQDRLSVDGMMHSLTDGVSEYGSEISDAVVRTVRRNPTAVGLTIAGLAWLAYSNARSEGSSSAPRYPRPGTAPQYDRRYSEPRHFGDTTPMSPEMPPRSAVPAGSGATGQFDDDGASPWDRAQENLRGARDRVSSGMRDASNSARRTYSDLRHSASERADRLGASARQLRSRIHDGTQNMSEDARRRVVAARSRAYEAQVKAEYYARKSRERATGMFDDQPLVVGALALAVGAAIGGALPRTSREDEAFGAYRDDLFAEAERIYREERSKIKNVAEDTADAARKEASGLVEDAEEGAKAAEKDVESRVKAVADTAKKSANRNGVGDSAKS